MEGSRAGWVLPAMVASVPQARRLLAETLSEVPVEVLHVVLLLSSELVTNAVLHGAGPVAVDVIWDGWGVRVEVGDQLPWKPVFHGTSIRAVSGRGLVLVDSLASHWGVVPDSHGKKVWFSVDL